MMKLISLSLCAAVLSACASKPAVDKPMENIIKPSYAEKVGAMKAEDLKPAVGCPKDAGFEKEEWHKQVALANACVKAKDFVRTEKIGNSLAVHAPLTPWGPYFMALAASSRKDYPRAQWMLELALKKAPNEGIFHYELGRLDWEQNDDAAAIKEMKAASDLNPSLTEAHFVVGQMALQAGDLSSARSALRKALTNDPKHGPSLLAAAAVEMKAGDFARAEEYLTQAIAVYPRNSKARFALAQLQEQHLKKSTEALNTYKQLKQLAVERKLDDSIQNMGVDEKIQTLEKSLQQVAKPAQVTTRKPTAERVSQ